MSLDEILDALVKAGGRPFYVGGCVRDELLGLPPKDIDIEVYGLGLEDLERCLSRFGEVDAIGKAFGILRIKGFSIHDAPVDFSVPRSDNKIGAGHKDFKVATAKDMDMAEAARRRDLTMNALSRDARTGEVFDFFGGRADMKAKVLNAVDPATFLEDPLRALRAAQFAARFEMAPSPALLALCRRADLSALPGERLYWEFVKLLQGRRPSKGLAFLKDSGLDRFFPELKALQDCPQEPEWHPEGDVWVHTLMAVDAAKEETDDLTILFAVLCHDLGKPPTTKLEGGRIRSLEHEEAGVEPTRSFLGRLRASAELTEAVCVLVLHHLAPSHFKKNKAGPGAYRRLARKLESAGTNIHTLYQVAKADHFGRTTPDALAKEFEAGDLFLKNSREVKVEIAAEPDAVQGRHLLARGMAPGPEFGRILALCRELQYERGVKDPEEILKIVLGKKPDSQAP